MIPKEIVDKLVVIFDDFISVRSAITLGAFFTVYVLVWFSKPVPDIILQIVNLLLGYWFGEKVTKATIQNGGGK
jgi:hypothetical protein